jgi:hypothetical protein
MQLHLVALILNNIVIGTNIIINIWYNKLNELWWVLFGSGTYSTLTGLPKNITGQTTTWVKLRYSTYQINKYASYILHRQYIRCKNGRLTGSSPSSVGKAIGVDTGNIITQYLGNK